MFSTRRLAILGSIVEEGEILPDPECLRPLRELPVPNSTKSLNRCKGLFRYYLSGFLGSLTECNLLTQAKCSHCLRKPWTLLKTSRKALKSVLTKNYHLKWDRCFGSSFSGDSKPSWSASRILLKDSTRTRSQASIGRKRGASYHWVHTLLEALSHSEAFQPKDWSKVRVLYVWSAAQGEDQEWQDHAMASWAVLLQFWHSISSRKRECTTWHFFPKLVCLCSEWFTVSTASVTLPSWYHKDVPFRPGTKPTLLCWRDQEND